MWIPYRGVNGEYGYLNTETGLFRTALPNSKEEKLKEQLKLRKAALVTHSARLAKYERTDARRRNHSDETVKKQVSVPIMTMNSDGTFANNYVLLMAPNESSLSTHDPIAEFYIGTKALNPVFNLLGKGYTYGITRVIHPILSAKTVGLKLVIPYMASILSNPDEYMGKVPLRVINFVKGRKSAHKGLEESVNFILSNAVKDSKEINLKIADRLGLSKQPEYDLRSKPVVYHKKFELKNFNLKGVNPDNVAGYYDPNKETVNFLLYYSNPTSAEYVAFHENLHAQNYGPSAVNDWKILYLIDKNKVKNMSQRNKDYYLSSKELPVHTAELGKRWEVKPGQPYPGDKTFDEMLYNNGISGSAYYLKYDTPKDKRRFWRTLNGTMFGLTLFPNVINKLYNTGLKE